jgi:hypothetical protein
VELAQAVEALGAGEILLNCIDMDGVGEVREGGREGRREGGRVGGGARVLGCPFND